MSPWKPSKEVWLCPLVNRIFSFPDHEQYMNSAASSLPVLSHLKCRCINLKCRFMQSYEVQADGIFLSLLQISKSNLFRMPCARLGHLTVSIGNHFQHTGSSVSSCLETRCRRFPPYSAVKPLRATAADENSNLAKFISALRSMDLANGGPYGLKFQLKC